MHMAICIEVDKQQPHVQTHTLHILSHIHTSGSPHGGEGASPLPPPPRKPSQALLPSSPPGSPSISRCHLNAYGHLYLSLSNPTPAEAKPCCQPPPVKSPCISTRLLNAYGMLFLKNAVPYVGILPKMCLKNAVEVS